MLICAILLASPLALWGEGNLVLLEDFDNSNKWNFDEKEYRGQVQNGKYLLGYKPAAKAGYSVTPLAQFPVNQDRDFQFETEIRRVEGDYPYGMLWGGKDWEDHSSVLISAKGMFRYSRKTNGKWKVHIKKDLKAQIRSSVSQINTITVKKSGQTFGFFINGAHAGDAPFEPLPGTRIGFVVEGKMKIQVERIAVVAWSWSSIPAGWAIRSKGNFGSKIAWSEAGGMQALFRADVGSGGLMELQRTVEGDTVIARASIASGPCVRDSACGVFIETDDGARLTLERTRDVKGPVVRFSTFAGGKSQGRKDMALPEEKTALKIARNGATFSGQVSINGKWVNVASLDWPGLAKRQKAGLLLDFSKPDPKLKIASCIYRFEGLEVSR
jgi:hypothetical protein